ncbi:carbonic anhydrase family protein [Pelomonas sp. SE-A7]|uniref:carbonic anhydrase n=1 Tax=Pelomonas sp. SE-A7 TaxID=3054953 RepID=UPI00259D2165|nr:carbonic anhydrase family protein [Pelomonas sp. SE-A7]MDM4766322.1 carbonic anhydrase family protein [Pelomonas sp. SE-A7]
MSNSPRALGLASCCLMSLALVPAWAASPKAAKAAAAPASAASSSAEEPLDVLKQRLTDRLSSKEEAAKLTNRGGRNEAGGRQAPAAKPKPPPHWGYAGDLGPGHWAELGPEYKQCAVGTRQSPIDIRDGIKVAMEPVKFDYKPGSYSVQDNGHTIQVGVAAGQTIEVMGKRYELQQLHFHRPAEERINGRSFEMSAHLVHKDAQGKLAVVAVLFDRGADDAPPQPAVQSIWASIPLEKHESLAGPAPLDLGQLLPADRGYYTYMGSLTTPPCSEGVLWMVMRQPVLLTAGQLDVFARLYPMNARPVQAGSGRLIKESQ